MPDEKAGGEFRNGRLMLRPGSCPMKQRGASTVESTTKTEKDCCCSLLQEGQGWLRLGDRPDFNSTRRRARGAEKAGKKEA